MKEYQNSSQDINRYRGTADRLESQIQTEIKIRTDLENRNAALDKEISKVAFHTARYPGRLFLFAASDIQRSV